MNKINHFLESMAKFGRAGFPIASSDEAERRMAVCKECDRYSSLGVCVECGCVLKLKVLVATEECPIGRWAATATLNTSGVVSNNTNNCNCGAIKNPPNPK
jgi:Family of unknown function (DUF6171)